MLYELLLWALWPIISVMKHRNEKLSEREGRAKLACKKKLVRRRRKTARQYAVMMYGLTGSGKSTVARAIASQIGATVIEADAIRTELRELGERYDNVWRIAEQLLLESVRNGDNVVLDRDNGEFKKQASVYARFRKSGVRIIRIRTYAHPDIMLGRIISAPPDDFFSGASTQWIGPESERGVVVKAREFWRRTPHHYRWSTKGDGSWALKKPRMKLDLDLDTSSPRIWESAIRELTQKLN